MRLLVVLCILLVSSFSSAGTISSVNGASNFIPASSGSTPTILAGMAGNGAACPGTGATCNTCDPAIMSGTSCTSPFCACNPARPDNAGTLSITLAGSGTVSGNVALSVGNGTTRSVVTVSSTSTTSASWRWSDVCGKIDTSIVDCNSITSNWQLNGTVFNDADIDGVADSGENQAELIIKFIAASEDYSVHGTTYTDGISGFYPYPGDEKIYLKDLETADNFPTLTYGSKVANIRVWRSSTALSQAIVESSDPRDVSVDSNGGTGSNIVSGLENDVPYVFRIAMVDEAGNIVQQYPGDVAASNPECETSPFTGCPWAATPEQVLGLLTDDFNCFIATAAYGSALEPKLSVFRDFRQKFLLQNRIGRQLIYWYYNFGPKAARYIHDKPALRALARLGLWPAYLFSASALHFGMIKTLMLGLMLFATGSFIVRFLMGKIFVRS